MRVRFPFLCHRSAKGVYNGEVAPLLHLAGVAVDVVETRERGQAKETAKSLDTNGLQGVLVVGDDGTMQVCVGGLVCVREVFSFRGSLRLVGQ